MIPMKRETQVKKMLIEDVIILTNPKYEIQPNMTRYATVLHNF